MTTTVRAIEVTARVVTIFVGKLFWLKIAGAVTYFDQEIFLWVVGPYSDQEIFCLTEFASSNSFKLLYQKWTDSDIKAFTIDQI